MSGGGPLSLGCARLVILKATNEGDQLRDVLFLAPDVGIAVGFGRATEDGLGLLCGVRWRSGG